MPRRLLSETKNAVRMRRLRASRWKDTGLAGGNLSRGKAGEIDLGLAVSGALLMPGQRRTPAEIAAFAGCSRQNIHQILERAEMKVRVCLRRRYGIESWNL